MGFFFGRKPILQSLAADHPKIKRILLAHETHGPIIDSLITKALKQGIIIQRVPRQKIESLFPNQAHQGMAAEIDDTVAKTYYTLDQLLSILDKQKMVPFLVILDGLNDPRNLGAIIRTAYAAGVQGIVIPKHRSSRITPTVIKTSSGATEFVPIIRVNNLVQACNLLRAKGLWIIGTESSSPTAWYKIDLTSPIAIILGSEGKGIHRLLRYSCDFLISIPMIGAIDSLNVSVAGGIIMYEVIRQRGLQKERP